MKNLYLTSAVLLSLFTLSTAFADPTTTTNVNVTNPSPRVDRTVPYDFKYNAYFHIPSLFVGRFGGGFDFKISPAVSIGPSIMYYAFSGARSKDYDGYNVGMNMNFGLSGNVMGDHVWLFNPFVEYEHSDIAAISSGKRGGVNAGALFKYQLLWNSGLNINIGFGGEYSSLKPALGVGGTHVRAIAALTLGYAFM